eukprot:185619-Pyramimonas_sp.AAC.1
MNQDGEPVPGKGPRPWGFGPDRSHPPFWPVGDPRRPDACTALLCVMARPIRFGSASVPTQPGLAHPP